MSQSRKGANPQGRFTAVHEHLINTKATEKPCHRCAASILEAHDDGLLVRVDTTPLDGQAGELAALLDARTTYIRTAGGQLYHRTAARIASRLLHGTLHAEHRCDPKQIQEALF